MKKTSQEIMNGCGKEFNEDEVCGCYIKWGNKVHLCPTCQAQKQERLECYKKFLKYINEHEQVFIEELEREIKILEGE